MVELFDVDGLKIKTDSLEDRFEGAVFPLFQDESLFFSHQISVSSGERVLDMGTGSGVLAIVAAKAGADVVASDINPKALEYAYENAVLNGVEDQISFVLSNGFEDIDGKFDTILFNPPFNPVPPDVEAKISSAGGALGVDVFKLVVQQASDYLETEGRMNIISFSLGRDGRPIVQDILNEVFAERSLMVSCEHLYSPSSHQDIQYFQRIYGEHANPAWIEMLTDKYPDIFYMFMEVRLDSQMTGFQEICLRTPFDNEEFSGGWDARVKRLQYMLDIG